MATTTVSIAGITGKFARQLATHLLKYPDVRIRGYGRDPSKVPSSLTSPDRVSLFTGEAFDREAIRSFVRGSDVVVCAYLGDPNLMTEGQKVLIDISEEEGVPRYVASDWSIDYAKVKLGDLFPKDPQILVKQYLEKKERIRGVHLLTGIFLEVFLVPMFGVWDPKERSLSYWGTGNEIWEGTTYENAAEFTAAVCLDKEAVGDRRLVGDTFNIFQVAEAFDRVYGVKPKLKNRGSLEYLWTYMHEEQEKKRDNIFAYMFLFYQYYMMNGQTLIGPDFDNKKYPNVKPVTLEDVLKTVDIDQIAGAYPAL